MAACYWRLVTGSSRFEVVCILEDEHEDEDENFMFPVVLVLLLVLVLGCYSSMPLCRMGGLLHPL